MRNYVSISEPIQKFICKNFRVPSIYHWINSIGDSISESLNLKSPPVYLTDSRLLDQHSILAVVPREIVSEEAAIIPTEDGYIVYYNPKRNKNRIRFSLAHEIGHIYLDSPDKPGKPLFWLIDWISSEPLANRIGASILMPTKFLPDTSKTIPQFLEGLSSMACDFSVSENAIAMRYISDLSLYSCFIIKAKQVKSKKNPPIWKVEWSVAPECLQQSLDNLFGKNPIINLEQFSTNDIGLPLENELEELLDSIGLGEKRFSHWRYHYQPKRQDACVLRKESKAYIAVPLEISHEEYQTKRRMNLDYIVSNC